MSFKKKKKCNKIKSLKKLCIFEIVIGIINKIFVKEKVQKKKIEEVVVYKCFFYMLNVFIVY